MVLFCPDEEHLRARVKVSTVRDTSVDTDATIDQATLVARTELYRRLGADRINVVLQEAYTETPTTDAQLLRVVGASCEISLVLRELLRRLNPLWMEGSGGARHDWNETPLSRQQGSREISAELERLNQDIDADLAILSGDVSFGSETSGGYVGLVEPSEDPPLPGRSVWPRYYLLG